MLRRLVISLVFPLCCLPCIAKAATPTAVVCDKDASPAEKLAGREIRRYFYLRTGKLLPIADQLPGGGDGGLIVVGAKNRPAVRALLTDPATKDAVDKLAAEQYALKSLSRNGRPVVLVVGGDDIGALYGAYRFAERLGVRFYLHGDVLPDRQITPDLPAVDETRTPLFDRRGIQPFHDFAEGPDFWNADAYKAVLSQLPKMGMNFFGLHCYPEGGVGPEPLVWIGPPNEIAADGKVKASYPSRHAATLKGAWGYRSEKTSDYVFGAADLFDRDDFGADYMRDLPPLKQMSPEQCNTLFDQVGDVLGDAFGFAHRLGIKTCVGTETPLVIPAAVKMRLRAAGKNPDDSAVVQELYEGMFQRIAEKHPLDYYWLWTSESWTWEAVKQSQIDAVMGDFRAFIAAAKHVKAPFTLATCGWVLGPPQAPSLFDRSLPKDMPMSCINRTVGNTPVEPGFAKIQGRPKWAIPWMEDDPALTIPQLWAGRMRRDAFDSLRYGCTGLLGIHWRTRILAPNVSALAKAAWDQSGWSQSAGLDPADPKVSRYMPIADFYVDWATAEFGPEAAEPIAAIFTRQDGHLPRPADWVTGPGCIKPNPAAWSEVQKDYAFVDELANLRPRITTPGNLERFDYWLGEFRCLRAVGKATCDLARFNAALDRAKKEKDPQAQQRLAKEQALPARRNLVADFAEIHRHLLSAVSTYGDIGNVCNWQQQTMPVVLTDPGRELAKLLGEDLPADAMPATQYMGPPRLFVPVIRSGIEAGESLRLTAIVLGGKAENAVLRWRPLGGGQFSAVPLEHVARGVYTVALPAAALGGDFEYYIEATVAGKPLLFPPTAPAMNQTVVVFGG
jgi:hypothetical protein